MRNLPSICISFLAVSQLLASEKPNIIFILADDMGVGDVSALYPAGKIKTVHLDEMARDGLRFSDAHSCSSVSTPTRYGILTGRYSWRSKLKSGVLYGYDDALLSPQRTTLGSLLQRANYETACIGKWHLGWDWARHNPKNKKDIDYSQPVGNGPKDLGFDYSYCISGSLDMDPYVYVENGMPSAPIAGSTVNKSQFGWWREGPTAKGFKHEDVLTHLTDKTLEYIKEKKDGEDPFFVYLAYASPHTPILPSAKWQGKSGLNPYGDFVMMMDSEVGRILQALEQWGIEDNTIVVFTADNGCSPAAGMGGMATKGHSASGIYRGHKADLFEGGHRVPCIVQWPQGLKKGECSQTICLNDFFRTFGDIAGLKLKDSEGEDSVSLLPLFRNPNLKKSIREATIHHSIDGQFAIRQGDWKLLASASSGGWSEPTPKQKERLKKLPPMQLYNLSDDPQEKNNLIAKHPQKAQRLLRLLIKQIEEGRSTAGKPQPNDPVKSWKQKDELHFLHLP